MIKLLHISQRDRLVVALILFIGLCYVVYNTFIVYFGDDVGYGPVAAKRIGGLLRSYYYWIRDHRHFSNGRMANLVAPLLLNYIPRWLLSVVDAAVKAGMFAIAVRVAAPARFSTTSRVLLLAILAFALPWWDAMSLFDCSFNYVWATAFGLLCVHVILNYPRPAKLLVTLFMLGFCFFSGAFHEAMGIPLACGFVAYFVMSRKAWHMSPSQLLLIAAFVGGAVFAFCADGIWNRFHRDEEPNDPMLILVLKSDLFALALVAFMLVQLVVNPRRLWKALSTPWVIFVVAAIASMCFSAVSGIVGRSGWFAQVYALIAFYRWADMHDLRISRWNSRVLNVVLALVMVVHYAGMAYYQAVVAGPQLRECMALSERNENGNVYLDALTDRDMPWWLLHKCRTVPDADDTYLCLMLTRQYSDKAHPIKILPTQVKRINAAEVKGEIALDRGNFVTDKVPNGTNERMWLARDGEHYVVVPFVKDGVQLYLITPHDLDPGDR
jgi:hypothetical protein